MAKTNPIPSSFAAVQAFKFNCVLCTQEVLFSTQNLMATHAVHHYITYHSVGSQNLSLLINDGYLAIAEFPNPAHIDEKVEDEEDD